MKYSFTERPFSGKKGGGGAHTPVEQPDDLLSEAQLKMLIALSEGEIQGDLTAQDIYLNDTPLANADGSYNFDGVSWEFRTGTQDQEYIAGLPEVDNEMSVGVIVTDAVPWTRQFTNLVLDAVRIKLSLPVQYHYKDNGDMVGTVSEYAIDLSTDGGAWQEVVRGKFDGKTTSEYQRDHRIDFPASTTGWAVRVRRLTPDSTDSKLVNAFRVFSFAEVIDSKLRYPNTALLYIEVSASQFNGSAPKVTCKPKGKIIRVPNNYDPVERVYTGSWSGGFKWAYSNNPAWIFYDLLLDEIYGMGGRVDASMIDKWELYEISRYCDERVADGAGGTEPRFTCDVFIQNQRDAYSVLNDLAAVFRGITFWGNEQLFVRADVPQDDVDWVYTAANVINGEFTYAGGSYKNRYSSCLVSWSDPINHYSDTVEGVYDSALVERYQINQLSLTAIGCTKQSEAHRRGRWALLSSVKDGSVTFGVGLDGYIPLPSQIIGVADPFRAGIQNGGRMTSIKGREVTLDRNIDYQAGDRLVMNMPDGTTQSRTIEAVSNETVTVTTAFSQTPVYGAVWAIDSDRVAIQYFRVMSVAASDDETGGFTITAIQHDPDKYRYIDDGVRIESPPVTVTPVNVLDAPENIQVEETDYIAQGLTVATMNVSWDKVEGAIRYIAQWRKDNGDWINVPVSSAQGFSVEGIYTGAYDVRVRALNAQETSSPWGYADNTWLSGKKGKPGTPINFRASDDVVWNIDLIWGFPDGSGDTAYTEIQRATTPDFQNPQQLTLLAYPSSTYQHGPLKAAVAQWYRIRLVDRIGNVGEWTEWIRGISSESVGDYLGDITGDFLTSEDGDRLTSQIDQNIEGILQNALANNATVEHQWAQYGEVRADILVVKTTIAEVDKALADMSTQVQAQIEDVTASLEEKLTAVVSADGASAIYTLKAGVMLDDVYYSAGMSIAVLAEHGQPVVTRIGFNANQFVLLSGADEQQYSPFSVINGQVFINEGFIRDGTITNAKIGDYIHSTNWDGTQGWYIGKDGSANFQNGVFRGTIYATDGEFKGTVYANKFKGDINDFLMGVKGGDSWLLKQGQYKDYFLFYVDRQEDIPVRLALFSGTDYAVGVSIGGASATTSGTIELVVDGEVRGSYEVGQNTSASVFFKFTVMETWIDAGTGTSAVYLRVKNTSRADRVFTPTWNCNVLLKRHTTVLHF